jgi:SAM-dependent methyltransferase
MEIEIKPKTRTSEEDSIRNACPSCECTEKGEPYKIEGGQWERCVNCGLLYIYKVGIYGYVTETRQLGPDVVLQETFNPKEPKIARVIAGEPEGGRNWRFDQSVKFAPRHDSVLELGFGGSENLDYAKKTGWKTVVGFEVSPDFILFARSRGHDVHRVDVSFHPRLVIGPSEGFDVVYATEVMEHVPNPKEFLIGASEYLALDGILWASFACTEALEQLTARKDDAGRIDEWHWWTRKSIDILVERCGLKVVDVGSAGGTFLVTMKKHV